MTDDELERRLRAWYHADIPDDETAPSALRSTLATITEASPGRLRGFTARLRARIGGVPRFGASTATAHRVATAVVIGAVVVGAVFGLTRLNQRDVGHPSPKPDPSSSPAALIASPEPSSTPTSTPTPSPEPCFTDTVQVVTDDAMRATVGGDYSGPSLTGLGSGRGVYIGSVGFLRSGLWAVGPGDGPARPIAAITRQPMVLDILDLSTDGSVALLWFGNVSVNSPDPECADLYAVRTDGSRATRLTALGGGRPVAGAAFSPDGRQIAYSSATSRSDIATLTALDTTTGRTLDQPCNNGYSPQDPVRMDWSPSGDRVAVACYQALRIFDPTGVTPPVDVPAVGHILAFVWTEDGRIITATEHGFTSYDVASRTSTTLSDLDASGIELVAPAPDSLSPDGRWFYFLGGERGDVPGDSFRTVGYLVSTSGATPTRIQNENEAGSVSWSADSRALIAAHDAGNQHELTLGRLDLETFRWSSLGTWPGPSVWQIP
jgi:WD40-like Beta Propeller Repeat